MNMIKVRRINCTLHYNNKLNFFIGLHNFQAATSTSTGGVQGSSDNGGKPSVVLNASIATKWEGWVCVSIILGNFTVGPPKFNTPFLSISPPRHLGRPNRHPIHDRLGRASPPIPLLWSNSTNFRKRPKTTWGGSFSDFCIKKTDHGYSPLFYINII